MHKVRNPTTLLGLCLMAIACGDASTDAPTAPAAAVGGFDAHLAGNTWTTKRPLVPPRAWTAAAAIDGVVYVVGGRRNDDLTVLARVDAYNIATNSWSRAAPLPAPRVAPNGASVISGRLYVTGGRNREERPTKTLFVYDPKTNGWTRKSDMPRVGHHGAQGVIDGQLYVYMPAAGDDPCPVLLRYDPATDRWTRRAPPPAEHSRGTGRVVNGVFYLAGGYTRDCHAGEEHWGRHNRLHAYDPSSNTWTTKAPMSSARSDIASAVLDGRLHVVGGDQTVGDFDREQPILEVYNPATDRWITKAPLPTGHSAGTAANADGKLFYVSGFGGESPSEVYAYTP